MARPPATMATLERRQAARRARPSRNGRGPRRPADTCRRRARRRQDAGGSRSFSAPLRPSSPRAGKRDNLKRLPLLRRPRRAAQLNSLTLFRSLASLRLHHASELIRQLSREPARLHPITSEARSFGAERRGRRRAAVAAEAAGEAAPMAFFSPTQAEPAGSCDAAQSGRRWSASPRADFLAQKLIENTRTRLDTPRGARPARRTRPTRPYGGRKLWPANERRLLPVARAGSV